MRAVIIHQNGGPEILRISDIPVPEPGPGQVQMRVAYAAVQPLDLHARSGAMKWGVPPFPFVLGYNYCGRVSKVGAGVDNALIGERVAMSGKYGGYADFAVAAAADLVPIPRELDWKLGGFSMGPSLTAWHMLHTMGRIRESDWIAVHSAAGPVGLMLTQIAKDAGCRVIGLVGGVEKLEWARQFGADHLIDYVADKEWPKTVMALTQNRGVDFIMDGNLGPDMPKEFSCLAPFGQIIAIGAMAGPAPEVNVSRLISGSHGVRGMVVSHGLAKTKGAERPMMTSMLASGAWKFPISVFGPLESIAEATQVFEARKAMGRLIVAVGGEI